MASAIDVEAVKKEIKSEAQLTAGTDENVDRPLIVVVNNDPMGNGIAHNDKQFSFFNNGKTVDPSHTKRKEFQNQSREACGAFCDFGACSFHGVSSCLIVYFLLRGTVNNIIASLLLIAPCSDANIHKLDNVLGPDFPYSCHQFHVELSMQLIDGITCVAASLMAIIGLIMLRSWLLIPVIIYGFLRIVYLLVIIFMFSDFVNIGAISGVIFSILWSLVFYQTYKIMKKVNEEWPTIELMKPISQNL
eukprot:CAMPEP_0197033360 /NCGR_PEP_ID=MMETSP1384-20130603/11791_1 /TAXON_ID=29189 /ORGANISM="Ammonia sp." /LENGTH=246 /DNA_ID=CAMNT_0042463161 /DNA_START=20 /DNA_END=760 /DNA_ORIENTATION=+